ncbi:MAG: UvrD-helicase domain-containing protein, partial [Polyangiaceae bacterium]|nr:UvrD-helicase domain-containing protein [Polyangiaceae bacterium]
RFLLQVEISNIYKRHDRVRKNHNLVFVPSLDAARRFAKRLEAIGNIASDGRPILGLDVRDLLEITLETDPLAFLVPAHVWTPWFSMLGSKSGFDSVEECFRDLAPQVFAAETGLSSDPEMNWRVSNLDRLTLISNSDAHSPHKLGREANVLDVDLSYEAILGAIRSRQGFEGTIEFFPEEGKYHLDGHRKCAVRLAPEQTEALAGRCPVCGGMLTVGVMNRVAALADRPCGYVPEKAPRFQRLVALTQLAAEVLGVGPEARSAVQLANRLRNELGPELSILREVPLEDIGARAGALLAEGVRRIRAGELVIAAGYDGEFGTIRIFSDADRQQLRGQVSLLGAGSACARQDTPRSTDRPRAAKNKPADANTSPPVLQLLPSNDPLSALDDEQLRAVAAPSGPLLVVAGPGSGKTRTLVARIARQLGSGQVRADQVLAIAFTNQAALELRRRLDAVLPPSAAQPMVCTFHAFGRWVLSELCGLQVQVIDDAERETVGRELLGSAAPRRDVARLLERVSLAKQSTDPETELREEPETLARFGSYETALRSRGLMDLDDLVLQAYRRLRDSASLRQALDSRFESISVDEYQDVNDVQAALVSLAAPGGLKLCAIGDPDQAIYGFRGSQPGHFLRFADTFPGTTRVELATTYRLTHQVAAAAQGLLGRREALRAPKQGSAVELLRCVSAKSEAEQVLTRIEQLVGGTSLFAVDTGRAGDGGEDEVGFGDIAVLVRTRAQRPEVLEALGRSGVPCLVVGEDEPHDPRSQKVAIMTMHASKGREFEVVFVLGLEQGLMPLQLEGFRTDPREERRLLYVAATRARRLLVLSHAAKRVMFGKTLPGAPSIFLEGLPAEVTERAEPGMAWRRGKDRQLDLF